MKKIVKIKKSKIGPIVARNHYIIATIAGTENRQARLLIPLLATISLHPILDCIYGSTHCCFNIIIEETWNTLEAGNDAATNTCDNLYTFSLCANIGLHSYGDGHQIFCWDSDFEIRSLTSIFWQNVRNFGKWPVFDHILIIICSLSAFKI